MPLSETLPVSGSVDFFSLWEKKKAEKICRTTQNKINPSLPDQLGSYVSLGRALQTGLRWVSASILWHPDTLCQHPAKQWVLILRGLVTQSQRPFCLVNSWCTLVF